MRKFFSLFAALTLSVGLWAEEVSYLYPVYNEGGATKGIKEWKTGSVEATAVESSDWESTLGADGTETWLVVDNDVTLAGRVTCQGAVHLILADNKTLTAQQGIKVMGAENSLTIYAQSTGSKMGQLIADATYNGKVAGIGGGIGGNGSNITINGGTVEATGGDGGAGIGGGNNPWGGSTSNIIINGGIITTAGGYQAAGIGGGNYGSASDITINGGIVEATGGDRAAGIGGGENGSTSNITINGGEVEATGGYAAAGIGGGNRGSASDIFVATSLVVKADGNNPPTTVITNTGADLANSLASKQYVTITDPLPDIKTAAIAAVNAEIAESDNDNVKAIATSAATAINAATTIAEVNTLKTLAIANIASAKAAYTAGETAGYNTGYDEGEAAIRATLPTEGYEGPAVIITKGEKVLILFNPEKVEYKILEAD